MGNENSSGPLLTAIPNRKAGFLASIRGYEVRGTGLPSVCARLCVPRARVRLCECVCVRVSVAVDARMCWVARRWGAAGG